MKGPAKIQGQGTQFLCGTIECKKAGYGKATGKTFSTYVGFVMFGRDIQALCARLVDGALVEASGAPEVHVYEGRDKKIRHSLKIVGRVELSLDEVPPAQSEPEQPPQAEGNEPDPQDAPPY
jgi:hypothetical protein